MNPKHSISFCPVCGGGLCGIRICHGPVLEDPVLEGPVLEPGTFAAIAIDDDPMSDPPSKHSVKPMSFQKSSSEKSSSETLSSKQHGLVVCDECEAIWLSPDTETDHIYPDPENARCPICHDALWGQSSHWASMLEIRELGWEHSVDLNLDFSSDEGVA